MRSARRSREIGLIRGLLLLLLLAALAAAGGWWWFLGRFARPDAEPDRAESVRAVLDYAGRRDLGTDPLEAMVKPDAGRAAKAPVDAKVYFARWSAAYGAAAVARVQWRTASTARAVVDAASTREHAARARLDYLHQARLAEWWRAQYIEAGGT